MFAPVSRLPRFCALLFFGLSPAVAFGQTGVSDDRVSLPEGPGSVDGFSDNAQINPNMGIMSYSVKIDTPAGFSGVTPSLSLAYSSATGNTVVGMGWDLALSSIERSTVRGLPNYDTDDNFVADGSEQLVYLPGSSPAEYRSRFERGFVRYRWHSRGDGSEGYWTAEYPDGTVGYFGADRNGVLSQDSRTGLSMLGTFRYYLHEKVDPFGHVMRFNYIDSVGTAADGTARLISSIEYLFDATQTARHSVFFDYEGRPDLISDCKSGYCEELAQRLTAVRVESEGTQIRGYALSYKATDELNALSRLQKVEILGVGGELHPAVFSFDYSLSLGAACAGASCEQPYLVSMGSLGVNITAGTATLIDINGDALPDVVDTASGNHRFFINQLNANGSQSWQTPVNSQVSGISGIQLSSADVKVLDVDGDGFADMVQASTGRYLKNSGSGDWAGAPIDLYDAEGASAPPSFVGDANLNFIDFDNDKRIDIIRSLLGETTIYRNIEAGGYVQAANVDPPIGAAFDGEGLELSDMNGDGLADAVNLLDGQIRYKLNLGWGHFSDWIVINEVSVTADQIPFVELEDINGDQLSDLVMVQGAQLSYSINRNGANFTAWQVVTSVGGTSLPERADSTVLFADMNGNGSSDIVWITTSGAVTYLELFPVRPNLLSRIENGLGMVTEIQYGSSVQQMAHADQPWAFRIPHATTVVTSMKTWEELGGEEELRTFVYADPFYDGGEKQFRGFSNVSIAQAGDAFQEAGLQQLTYEVGNQGDAYRYGLMLSEDKFSGGDPIASVTHIHEDCPVAGLPTSQPLAFDVRHICETASIRVLKERQGQSAWVTVEEHSTFDGYGNVLVNAELGVTQVGGTGCAPCENDADYYGKACGAQCLGDERFTTTEYATPTQALGRWMIHLATRERNSATETGPVYAESLTYYDGPDFEGLALGSFTKGAVTRVEQLVSGNTYIQAQRNRIDAHGNAVEVIDPNGTVSGQTHRRVMVYDADFGQDVLETRLLLQEQDGSPYELRHSYTYEPHWGKVESSSGWVRYEGGQPVSPQAVSTFAFDNFGRVIAIARPGADSVASPTEQLQYNYGSPVSQVTTLARSVSGGAFDVISVKCFDGRGRLFQERTQVGEGKFQVSGLTVYNARGSEVRKYQPYEGTSAACDATEPQGVPFLAYHRDADYRELEVTAPDADIYGTASAHRTEYRPLQTLVYDAEDTQVSGTYSNTPTVNTVDGLGRRIDVQRQAATGAARITHQLFYDALGHLRGYKDPDGNERLQVNDRLGRVLRVQDPDAGLTEFTYDATNNRLSQTDARGVTTRWEYDGDNRIIAEYEQGNMAATRIEYQYDAPANGCSAAQCTYTAGLVAGTTYPLADGSMGHDAHGYDARGNGIYLERTLMGRLSVLRAEYDNAGRLVAQIYPGDRRVQLTLDGGGRIVAIPGVVDSIEYDLRGDMARLTHTNGAVTNYAHDSLRRLQSMATTLVGDVSAVDLTYSRDRVGNIVAIHDGRASAAHPSHNATFSYDALYRLTGAALDANQPAHADTLSIAYNNVGNIVSKVSSLHSASGAHVGDYSYQSAHPHMMTSAGSDTFAYDAAGNMTSFNDQAFVWDFAGRLTAKTGASGDATFSYGPSRERVAKQEDGHLTLYVSPDYEIRDGHAVVYVTVGGQQIAKIETGALATQLLHDVAPVDLAGNTATVAADGGINAADAWVARASTAGIFSLADATSDPRELLAASVRNLLAGTSDKTTYYHFDHQGTVIAQSDMTGALTDESTYYPYGLVRWTTGGALEDQRYTGKETDRSTGLTYFGARYASLKHGRWISVDPEFQQVGSAEAFDRPDEATGASVFNTNNPMNMRDADGRIALQVFGAIVGASVSFTAAIIRQVAIEGKPQGFGGWGKAIGKVLLETAIGAVSGALTGGLSAISTVASTAAEVGTYKYKMHALQKAANATNSGTVGQVDIQKAKNSAALWGLGVGVLTGVGMGALNTLTGSTHLAARGLESVGAHVTDIALPGGIGATVQNSESTVTNILRPAMESIGKGVVKGLAKIKQNAKALRTTRIERARQTAQGAGGGQRMMAR